MSLTSSDHNDPPVWEHIFQREGRLFLEPHPRFDELVEVFKLHGCTNILDLGCGSGRHVVALASQGFKPVGLDNAPQGLRLARQWLEQERLSAPLVLGDVCQPLPFPGEVFDGLLSTRVIHHARLATVIKTAGEIARVLKSGGVLFLTVPAGKKSKGGLEEIEPHTFIPLAGFEKGLPHHIFSAEELRSLFPQFEVLDLSLQDAKEIALLAVKQPGSTQSNQSGLE